MSSRTDKYSQQLTCDPEQEQLEKFKQETQYVCLKLAVKDWNTFLAEVRLGNIIKKGQGLFSQTNNQNYFGKQSMQSNLQFNAFLTDLLQNIESKKSTDRKTNCECESPICMEQRIQKIKGSQSSSNLSSLASLVDNNSLSTAEKQGDPFQKFKIESLWGNNKTLNQQALSEIMKNVQKYQSQKQTSTLQGFQTFRKTVIQDNALEDTLEGSSGREHCFEKSTGRKKRGNSSHNKDQMLQFDRFQKVASDEWIRDSIQTDTTSTRRQFVLALENTKLRRQIKLLERMLQGTHDAMRSAY